MSLYVSILSSSGTSNHLKTEENMSFTLPCTCQIGQRHQDFSTVKLTAYFNSYEVFNPKVFQEHPRDGSSFEEEGDVRADLGMEGGEVQVGGLRVEGSGVPELPCKHNPLLYS